MKKIVFTLILAVLTLTAMAQNDTTATGYGTTGSEVQTAGYDTSYVPVIRSGNTYIVNDVRMDKRGFMDFLQTRDAMSYNSFRSAYNISVAGWALLGVGVGMNVAGGIMAIVVPLGKALNQSATPSGVVNSAKLGMYLIYSGDGVAAAGAACVAVGYVRMHNAADNYNAVQGHRRKSSGVKVALQSSVDGLGIAFMF